MKYLKEKRQRLKWKIDFFKIEIYVYDTEKFKNFLGRERFDKI